MWAFPSRLDAVLRCATLQCKCSILWKDHRDVPAKSCRWGLQELSRCFAHFLWEAVPSPVAAGVRVGCWKPGESTESSRTFVVEIAVFGMR